LLEQYIDPNGVTRQSSAVWFIIYLLGTVPAGISNAYKQKCLKSVDLEVMYASLFSVRGRWTERKTNVSTPLLCYLRLRAAASLTFRVRPSFLRRAGLVADLLGLAALPRQLDPAARARRRQPTRRDLRLPASLARLLRRPRAPRC
jgi:hypothetical protein